MLYYKSYWGVAKLVKAQDFDSCTRWFESSHPSQRSKGNCFWVLFFWQIGLLKTKNTPCNYSCQGCLRTVPPCISLRPISHSPLTQGRRQRLSRAAWEWFSPFAPQGIFSPILSLSGLIRLLFPSLLFLHYNTPFSVCQG